MPATVTSPVLSSTPKLLAIHPQAGPITAAEQTWATGAAAIRATHIRKVLHLDLLAAGQYMARRGFMALSLPMNRADIDSFIEAATEFVHLRRAVLR